MIALLLLATLPGQFIENDSTFPKARQQEVLEATVRITMPPTHDHGAPVGTGVIVLRSHGTAYILTADHVLAVDGGGQPTVSTFTAKSVPFPNAKTTKVTVVQRLPDVDLAVLRAAIAEPTGVIRMCPKEKMAEGATPTAQKPLPVLTAGMGGSFDSPFLLVDKVTGLRRAKPGSSALFFQADTAPSAGRSGGPLVDRHGYLIGICSGTRGGRGFYVSIGEIRAALGRKNLDWLADGKPPP
jgi:S1-C subfamily serine protease